ncbi:MAG TPA: LytTR family DNA-binding domain-containing protein [Flavisolibacter sp.]|jgi:DNA-binding LytR/AlgR family response regulator|nr:LytTR family DNA-binding domain-containing protein [Flavisolibacter sp.]
MIKTIIIEDEKPVLDNLIHVLAQVSQDIHITATLSSVKEGMNYMSAQPEADLILSDVQLTDGLSFEIFNEVKTNIPVIFITAFDHFMLSAFEYNGIDYLLKPVSQSDLSKALSKYQKLERHFSADYGAALQKFVQPFGGKRKQHLLVRRGLENILLRLEDVVLFYTENKVVFVLDQQGKKYVCDKNLSDLEMELDASVFFRANRQYIVNIEYIRSFKAYEKVKLKIDLSLTDADHFIIVSQETAPLFKKWISEN